MTLDKTSHDSQDNSIIESIDDVKEQFIQIADLNMDFFSARDIQTAQAPVTTQLIHMLDNLKFDEIKDRCRAVVIK